MAAPAEKGLLQLLAKLTEVSKVAWSPCTSATLPTSVTIWPSCAMMFAAFTLGLAMLLERKRGAEEGGVQVVPQRD